MTVKEFNDIIRGLCMKAEYPTGNTFHIPVGDTADENLKEYLDVFKYEDKTDSKYEVNKYNFLGNTVYID